MSDGIDKYLENSSKAELLEILEKELGEYNKAIVVLVKDLEDGKFANKTMLLGVNNFYEAYGILEIGRQDIESDDV